MKKITFSLRGYFSPWVNLYVVMSFHHGLKDVYFSQRFLPTSSEDALKEEIVLSRVFK